MVAREYRDAEGRTFPEFVADQVMGAIVARGKSIRAVAKESGIERTRLGDRLNNKRPFTTDELARVAAALNMHPGEFVKTTSFVIVGGVATDPDGD